MDMAALILSIFVSFKGISLPQVMCRRSFEMSIPFIETFQHDTILKINENFEG